jgi:thiamine kinase
MPEQLPEIQSIIERIPGLEGAEPVRRLPGGEASVKWLLKTGNQRFVLRIDRPVAAVLGLDRRTESEILEAAGEAGIGPRLIWAGLAEGIQVCTFIEGEPWTREETRNPALLSSLARTLASLHRLPPIGRPFDPAGAARRYAALIPTAKADALASRACQIVEGLSSETCQSALCHNDLVHTNIVGHGPVRLIDWEYAAVGDPCFDLAIVIRHHELSRPLTEVFLDEYARTAEPISTQRLQKNCELYDLLAALWYQSQIPGTGPSSPFQEEWQRVMLRLNESRPDQDQFK